MLAALKNGYKCSLIFIVFWVMVILWHFKHGYSIDRTHQRTMKALTLVKFMEEWLFSMVIHVWTRGQFMNGWKDSKEDRWSVVSDGHLGCQLAVTCIEVKKQISVHVRSNLKKGINETASEMNISHGKE